MQRKSSTPKILILGSCVSRDIFNFSAPSKTSISDYYARSSLASLTTHPCAIDDATLDAIASPFQRKTVRRDLDKDLFRNGLRRLNFDALLIDLIDERFDLCEMTADTVVTLSSEFLSSGMIKSNYRESDNWIASGSERHRTQWKSGVSRLFSELNALGLAERVIINKVFWSDKFEDGSFLSASERNGIAAANELLEWMYGELEQYVPPERWMQFSETTLGVNPQHPWGIAPFHYGDAYYRVALGKLETIINTLGSLETASLSVVNHVLKVNASCSSQHIKKFLFLVFKGNELVHRQPYADHPSIQFDTQSEPGLYSVVCTILKINPGRPDAAPERIMLTLTHEITAQI